MWFIFILNNNSQILNCIMCKTSSSLQKVYFIKLHKYVKQIHLFYKTWTDAILGSNMFVTFLSEASKIGYFDIRHTHFIYITYMVNWLYNIM